MKEAARYRIHDRSVCYQYPAEQSTCPSISVMLLSYVTSAGR